MTTATFTSAAPPESTVVTWYDTLYRFALVLSRNEDEAADLTRRTFVGWEQQRSRSGAATEARSWLFMTLYREYMRARRGPGKHAASAEEGFGEDLPVGESSSHVTDECHETMAALQASELLSRAPLALFYLGNHTCAEIAAILAMHHDAVIARIARGREQLRRRLQTTFARQAGEE